MPLPGLLLTPVTLIWGPSVSYNLLVLITPGLLCYAMYRAARLCLGHRRDRRGNPRPGRPGTSRNTAVRG